MPSASAGAGRFFQARTMNTTDANPAISATKGMIHATRPKPVVLGAATTVVPYFCMKDCRMRSSLSPPPPSERGRQFAAHAVGVLAADVIAFQQDLVQPQTHIR